MTQPVTQTDVLVLGEHACAYLATAILAQDRSIHVTQATIPGNEPVDPLVLINPAMYTLHPLTASLKRRVESTPVYGLRFLSDTPNVSNAHLTKSISGYVARLGQIQELLRDSARKQGANLYEPSEMQISQPNENGVHVVLDGKTIHARLVIVSGELPRNLKQPLGVPPWSSQILHRVTFLRLKGSNWFDAGKKPIVPVSLDLDGAMIWAWLLPWKNEIQLAVSQSVASLPRHPPLKMLRRWIEVLIGHELLDSSAREIDLNQSQWLELPLAGALVREDVANRTLLFGPAGGFLTASAEDIYPTCWSAIYAVELAKRALKAAHVQDALRAYREKWGATLGDYLRGPQQNLKFLLPLVYRNDAMAARMTEAILHGKSVVK